MRTEMKRSYSEEMSGALLDWRAGARLFGEIAPARRWEQLSEVVRAYRPDVIVSEALELAGPLVAKLAEIPHLFHSIGPYHADSLALLWERARPLYERHLGSGITLKDIVEPYIDICPPALQTPEGEALEHRVLVGLHAYHGAVPAPPAPDAAAGRPRVLVTFGTVSNAAVQDYRAAAEALAEYGMDVTLTLGPQGWFSSATGSRLSGTPQLPHTSEGRVRCVDFAPLNTELPTTSVLVHHGGSNTTRAGIEWGIPMLVIPQGPEQYRNARWAEQHGLGRVLTPAEATPAAVVRHVAELARDQAVRQRLAEAKKAWLAMPGPDVAVEQIERLARTMMTKRNPR
ncbi:glycosyltransferase [Streptomyces xanthochromogenes]|uniref:glycosyltransferase n=1 Tax=Streptomyces xanthochromogenes TaxID=67384 RepID=UPI0034312524